MKKLVLFLSLMTGAAGAAVLAVDASMSALPLEVRVALQDSCHGCKFADAGTPWNSTDMIFNNLPQRRLISIEHSGAAWRVQYEHGGRGQHSHTVTFSTLPVVHVISTEFMYAVRNVSGVVTHTVQRIVE